MAKKKETNNLPALDDNDQIWKNRISRREKNLEQTASANKWEGHVNKYKGQWDELTALNGNIGPLNLVFAYVKTELPLLYIKDPHFEFTPKKKTSIESAKLKELAVNDIWHRKKIKREVKKCIIDAKLIGHAIMKVGYSANLGTLENGEQSEFISDEDFFAYRINWRHVLWNDEAVDVPHDCQWMAQKFYMPLEAVKAKFGEKAQDISGVRLTGNEKSDAKKAFINNVGDVLMAELWEVWDKTNKKILIVSTQTGVLNEREWPYKKMKGFPFVVLYFNPINDEAFGVSDVGMAEWIILEKAKLRNAFLNHVKRGNRQILAKQGVFSQEAKDAYERGDDSALIEINGNPQTDVGPAPYAQFQPDTFGLESRLDDDLMNILGQHPGERGGQARTQTRTKFELQKQDHGSVARRSEQVDNVSDFTEEIAEKLCYLLEQYATEPYYVAVTGKLPQEIQAMIQTRPSAQAPGGSTSPYGFTFTNQDIAGETDVRVKEGTTVPLDRLSKIELIKEMFQLSQAGGALPGGPWYGALARMLVSESGMPELEVALDEELAFQQQAQAAQSQMTEEQKQLQAADRATQIQLDAEKLALEKLKIQSDAMLDLQKIVSDLEQKVMELEMKESKPSA